jgi:thioredoxin-related protein
MKPNLMRPILALAAVALVAVAGASVAPEYPKMGADIYDAHADASVQIAGALAKASAQDKRVLLIFGANWCIWCHRLHATLESEPAVARALDQGFVLVMVDVNTRKGEKRNAAVNDKYGDPIKNGIPVLVVLGADGKQLTTKDSGELEEGEGHSPAKILAFLSAWAPAPHP